MAPEQRKKTLLCADSALVTKDNLTILAKHGFRFVSRLPNTFGWTTTAKAEALFGNQDRWIDLGQLGKAKNSASYRLLETDGEIDGRTYRLIVVHSTSLADRKTKSLMRKAEAERKTLQKAATSLSRRLFNCAEDGEQAVRTMLEEIGTLFWQVEYDVLPCTIEQKRGRGRPAKDAHVEPQHAFRVDLRIGERKDAVLENERRWESTFVLIRNDPDRSARELFEAYRGQAGVEAAFRWLKAPVHVSPVFLKKPERVEAFGYVMLMAYLVYALIQRAIRKALPDGELLEIEGRKTGAPTAQAVLDVIARAQVLHVRLPGRPTKRIFLTPSYKLRRIMQLLGIPADAFLTVPVNYFP